MKRVSHRKLRRASKAIKVSGVRSRRPRPLGISLARYGSMIAVAGALFASIGAANAANYVWDPVSGDSAITDGAGTWTLGSPNWFDGVSYDQNWVDGNDATFGGGTSGLAGTVTLGGPITVGSLTFAPPFSGNYTIDTSTFGLTLNTGITVNESATIQSDVGGSVILGANNAWSVASGKTLTITSNVGESVSSSLSKSGSGTLILSGAGSYTGGTAINEGILQSNHASALGTTGNISFGGGTLQYTALSAATDLSARFKNSTLGPISLDTNGQNVTLAGIIDASNTGGLSKTGAGTLILSGANAFTGNIAISGGALQVTGATEPLLALGAAGARDITITNNAAFKLVGASYNPTAGSKRFVIGSGGGTLDVASSFTLQLDDANQLAGSGDLTKTSAGTLLVTAQSGFTGIMTISGGVLSVIDALSFGSELRMGASTTLTLRGNLYSTTPTKFNGDVTIGGAFTSTFSNVDLGAGSPRTLTVTATAVNFPNALANAVGLTKAGAGMLSLGGTNTYSGTTTVSAGLLRLDAAAAIPGGIGATDGTSALTFAAATGNTPVLGLAAGNFNRDLGTGSDQVQFTGTAGGAGFAAFNANRIVNLGGASAGVTWNTGGFVPSGVAFVLSNVASNASIDFQNPIDLNGATRTVQVDNGNQVVDATLSGILSGGASSALTKTGAGTLALTEANTYPGLTTISAGVLRASNADALGTTAAGTTVAASSALEINGVSIGAEALTLNGTGPALGGALRNITGTNTYGGLVTLGSATRINSDAGTLTLTNVGTITGATFGLTVGGAGNTTINSIIGTTSGTLTKDGAGTLTLTGANTYTGTTTVNRGVLSLDYTGASSRLSDTSALVLGGGTVTMLNGATTETVFSTTVNPGASSLTRTAGTGVFNLNTITRNVGGTVNFGATNIANTDSSNNIAGTAGILGGWATVAGANWAVSAAAAADTLITNAPTYVTTATALNVPASYASVNIDVTTSQSPTAAILPNSLRFNNATARTLTLFAGSANVITTGGILVTSTAAAGGTIAGTGTLAGSAGGDLIVHQNSAGTFTISAPIVNNGGATGLTKSGTGSLVLSGVNTYTGNTYLNGGNVTISAESGLGAVPGAATPGNVTFNGGQLTLTTTSALALSANRGITLGASGGTVSASSTTASGTIAGIIAGDGTLTKIGPGVLVLSGTNTYTGATIINAGTISMNGSDTRLGAAPAAPTPGHLTLNGGALQITANVTLSANRGILLGTSGGTLNPDANITLTYAGTIDGTGNLTKSGSGTVTLTGSNNYSGTTSVTAGVLNVNGPNPNAGNTSITGGTLSVGNNLSLGSTGTITLGDTDVVLDLQAGVNISRPLTVSDTGNNKTLRFNVAGEAGYSGPITVNDTTAGQFDITAGSATGVFTISGPIGGTAGAGVTKEGSGTVRLVGDNTNTAITQVNAGTLVIAEGGDIAQSSSVGVSSDGRVLQINERATDSTVVDRIGNTAPVTLNNGAMLNLNGTTAAGTTIEDVGALGFYATVQTSGTGGVASNENFIVTLNPGSGQDVQLQADSLGRSAGTTLLFRGTGLGSAAGSDTSRIKFDVVPTLFGGGGASGTNTISVLPSALADVTTTGLGGAGFVTYDSTLGVRLLNLATEYDTTLVGTANRNINLTANTALAADQTIGSLRIAGGDLTVNVGQTLTNTSGAILFTTANNINGPGTVALGNREGFIHGLGGAAIAPQLNAVISGSGGLTVNVLAGNTVTLGGNNTFTGPVTINSGTLKLGAANALGQSTSPTPNPLRVNLGSLDLNGQNATIGTLYGGSGAGLINNSSASPVTLTINTFAGNGSFTPVISQTGGGAVSIVKAGTNIQTLAGASTITGTLDVTGGTLALSGTLLNLGAGGITVRNGATFTESTGAATTTNRIADAASVTLEGGTFNFNTGAGAFSYAETLAGLTLNSGGSTINANSADAARTSRLTFDSLTRNTGATVNFTGANLGDVALVSRNQILFTSVPATPNGILGGYATLNGLDWATYLADADTTTAGNQPSVSPLGAGSYTLNPADAGFLTTLNVKLTGGSTALTANRSINSINFAPTGAATLDLGGQTLRVESGGVLSSGAFSGTIQNGTLTAGTGTGGDLFFHTYSPTGNVLTVNSIIADDGVGNVVNVTKAGTGKMLLTGNNTYTGTTALNNGTLLLGHASALGNTTANVRLNGGTLASDGATARTVANPVTIGGNISFGESAGGTGAIVLSGAVDIPGTGVRTVTTNNSSANVNEISGVISGVGGLAKAGNGTLKISGVADNTYSGNTVVNQGTLVIDNTTLTTDWNPLGSGQLQLGGGTVTITGGGAGGPYADIVTSAAVAFGHSRINTTGSPTYVLRLNTLSASTGATLDFSADNIAQVDNANINGILGGYATVNGTDWAQNSTGLGDGSVTAFSGYINGVSTSPASWTVASNLTFAASPAPLLDNATASTLRFTAGSGVNLAAGKTLTLDSGGILNTGTALSGLGGGIIRGGSAQQQLVIQQYNTAQPLIIASTIADNGGPTALVKSGPGELIIANDANTFTGIKYLNGGTLTYNLTVAAEGTTLGTARSLGAISTQSIDLVFNGGTLAFGPLTASGQATPSNNREIRLDTQGGTLLSPAISGVQRVMQLDATIFGVGSLTFAGNGAFLPNDGGNTYSGGTFITGTALVMPNVNTPFGSGPVTMTGGALTVWSSNARTIANPLFILGNVTLGYSGATGATASSGDLTLTGAVGLGGATRQITVDSGKTTTLSGIVSDGGVTKTGAGTLTLSGANSFSGPLTINNGTVVADTLTNATVLNPALALTLGGGTFRLSGFSGAARSQVLNGLSLNAGSNVVDANNVTGGTSTTIDLRGLGGTAVITRNAGSTVDFRATTGTFGTTAIVQTAQPNDATGILGGWATVSSGANLARNDGAGNIVAYAAYTDITTLNAAIADGTTTNVRVTTGGGGSMTLGASPTNINTLTYNVATAGTIATAGNTLRLGTTGAILITPTAAALSLTIGAAAGDGFLTAGGNAIDIPGELILNPNNSTATAGLIVNAVIADNGTGAVGLTKAGTATVTLNAVNTYSGDTVVGAGTLKLGAANIIPNGVSKGNVTVNGTLDLNNFDETINGLNGYGIITNVAGTGTRTLTIGDNDASGIFNGVITAGTGTTGLTKIGTGTQIFAGQAAVSTYTAQPTFRTVPFAWKKASIVCPWQPPSRWAAVSTAAN